MSTAELAPGANVAALRKSHNMSQRALARKAGVSLSLLSKVEVGDRALTPDVAATVGRALGVTKAEVLGQAQVQQDQEEALADLRAAVRDYDFPGNHEVHERQLQAAVKKADGLRKAVDVDALLKILPGLLREATTHAHRAHTIAGWADLAEVYSIVYWLAARHRWMDLAELAVTRERWAVEQKPSPLGEALAARDRAGTYLNFGDIERGLMVVNQALAKAGSRMSGPERDAAVGILNLRGMTLAGRLPDKKEAKKEAAWHIQSAGDAYRSMRRDVDVQGHIWGPQNVFCHRFATSVDLGDARGAMSITEDIPAVLSGLPPTRVAPTHMMAARAQLDLGDREGALDSLSEAWRVAPQMARIHPTGREVLRVLTSLHRRSNARLMELAKLSGMQV